VKNLTEQQLRIAEKVALGWTNKQIADEYYLCEGTVRNHLYRIYRQCRFPYRYNQRVLLALAMRETDGRL